MSRIFLLLLAATFVPGSFAQEQTPATPSSSATDSSFEVLPELKASEILKPELLKGPQHSVREPVPTAAGMNQFVIDSDFGVFEADGNEMLLRRIKEVYAIAQLKEVSRTDQFTKALAAAAKSPLVAAKKLVTEPVETISKVPKGVMKFLNKAGNTIKNAGKGKELGDDAEGSKTEQALGVSKARRSIALSLGIDPYSSNQVLMKELDEIAWASWAGGFVFSAATFPISGPAKAALTATNMTSSAERLLKEKTPEDLRAINRKALITMGANARSADIILGNDAFSPTHATSFVLNLQALGKIANRGAFIRSAAENSTNEADALFCVQTAQLMGQVGKEMPLDRIVMLGDFPVCVSKEGAVVVALQWDYAAWTERAAAVIADVEALARESGNKGVSILLSGMASPRLKQELENRKITLKERVSPGPLK